MGFHPPRLVYAKQIIRRSLFTANQDVSMAKEVAKGHLAVYTGEDQKKRFAIPISYINHPSFRDLLSQTEEEFGFDHPMGGLTIPCGEDVFVNLLSSLNGSL